MQTFGIHPHSARVSEWVQTHVPAASAGAEALDLACGAGRHASFLAARGFRVLAIDRDAASLDAIRHPQIEVTCADIEGDDFCLAKNRFALVVVTNYLYRPLFPALIDSLADGGCLIYETFAVGNEAHGRPTNPDFLLTEAELLIRLGSALKVEAYHHGFVSTPKPAVVQRVFARQCDR